MTNVVMLNNVDHADLCIDTRYSARYGNSVNQTTIFPSEFEEVQREYPILFRKDDRSNYQAVALLGFDRDENLFLHDGVWQARYAPVMQRRGPFSIGVPKSADDSEAADDPLIFVDLDHPQIAGEGGTAVFLPHGGNSSYLDQISTVLRAIFIGSDTAAAMYEAFAAVRLMEPAAITIDVEDGRSYRLEDYYTISADRLHALDGPTLAALNAKGYLAAAILAMSSLGNVYHLIERKNRKDHGA